MRPFVLATTSIGQEGLDFHPYCRKIMHWNLPSNPIDLEQREGRINRYKCLAIRQDLAMRFSDRSFKDDVWQELFTMAAQEMRTEAQSDLVPYWCLGKDQKVKIERIIPMYPVSKDEINYDRLIKVLSLYRLTMGQARQEELVDYILESGMKDNEYVRSLFIDLSPYSRTNEGWKKEMRERKPVAEVKKKTKRQARIEKLQKELEEKENQLVNLKEERVRIKTFKVLTMIVTHKSLGEGMIVEQDRDYIKVDFEIGLKEPMQFKIPDSFESGFLKSEYPDFLANITRGIEIDKNIETVSKRIEECKEQLEALII